MTKARILIVEDELIIASDYKARLTKLGYEVLDIVNSGEDAVKAAEEFKPNIILMDITIKGNKDGIQAGEEIQERFNIPVAYLTAHIYDSTIKKHMKQKPLAYLTKPIDDEDLHKALQELLATHSKNKA